MQSIADLRRLEELADQIDKVFTVVSGQDCERRERAARDAYDSSIGLLERLFMWDFYKNWHAAACPVRDQVYEALPRVVSVAPQIAYYLAVDQATYDAMVESVHSAFESESAATLKGMALNVAEGMIRPAALIGLGIKSLNLLRLVLRDAIAVDRVTEGRNRIAASVLHAFKLVEASAGQYELHRGKWGLEALHGAYHTSYVMIMTENGIDAAIDARMIASRIDGAA